jgi:YD repeat-containing protein
VAHCGPGVPRPAGDENAGPRRSSAKAAPKGAASDAVNGSLSWTLGYDALDRLTSASKTGQSQSWTYDANGNRLTQGGSSSSTYTVSSTSNRLSSISGALSRTYGYDAAGNTTSYGGFTFGYNDAGRLTSVSGSASASYQHNALGQRVKKTVSGVNTYFVYDEAGHLIGEYDGSGNLIQETAWLGDIPVATLRPNGGSISIFYVHTDHLNTPRRISRPTDNVILWRWDSDPFGTDAANQDPDADSNQFAFQLRFPGQYFDAETGLSYNYFRDFFTPTASCRTSARRARGSPKRNRACGTSPPAACIGLDHRGWRHEW